MGQREKFSAVEGSGQIWWKGGNQRNLKTCLPPALVPLYTRFKGEERAAPCQCASRESRHSSLQMVLFLSTVQVSRSFKRYLKMPSFWLASKLLQGKAHRAWAELFYGCLSTGTHFGWPPITKYMEHHSQHHQRCPRELAMETHEKQRGWGRFGDGELELR